MTSGGCHRWMPQPSAAMPLLSTGLLALVLLLLLPPPADSASVPTPQQPVPVDVLEGQWHQFDCVYNPTIDNSNLTEMAVTVLPCDQRLAMPQQPDVFTQTIVAAVIGKLAAFIPGIRAGIVQDRRVPFVFASPDHPLVRAGLVRATDEGGDTSRLGFRVRADANRTDGLCLVCGQTAREMGYTVVKTESLRIRKPPTAVLTFTGEAAFAVDAAADGGRRWELREGSRGRVTCAGQGEAEVSLRLFRNGELLKATTSRSLTHDIDNATRAGSSGEYKCQAISSLPFLVEHGSHLGSDSIVLAVKFGPQFELSEVVRYTPVGEQEDIQVKVLAYPEADLTCSPSPVRLEAGGSYNDKEFYRIFQLTLTNLASDRSNETEFRCTASNTAGEQALRIRLTARAPRPEITSGGGTQWYNSYRLKWQHDANARIDHYYVEIVYKGENATKTLEKFGPNSQRGPMALVDRSDSADLGKRLHSGFVYNLRPDTEHEIRLRSCNQHGCSDFSEPVRVHTQRQSDQTYNDPANPVKALSNPDNVATKQLASFTLLSMALVGHQLVQLG